MIDIAKTRLSPDEFIKALKGQDDRFITMRRLYQFGPEVRTILFENIEVDENIYLFEESHYALHPIVISNNVRFNKHFTINAGIFLNEINFDGGVFAEGFTIRGGTFNESLMITGGEYYGLADLTGGVYKSGLSIISGYFDDLTIAGVDCSLWLNISGGNFMKLKFAGKPKVERSINISSGNFHKLIFEMEIPNLVKIEGDEKRLHINTIEIHKLLLKENLFSFKNIQINNLKFDNLINNGQIYFNNVTGGEAFIFELSNQQIKLRKYEVDTSITTPKFQLLNSDLGKTTFIDCDLSSFELIFKSSKINEVFLAGTEWFLPKQINATNDNFDFRQDKLVLSQTKKIYENMGDTASVVEYNARELNMHLKYLKQERKNLGEIFQLTLNKWSSNHGEDYVQALCVLMSTGIFLFVIDCITLTEFSINFSPDGFTEFFRRSLYLLEFLNPLHKVDFLAERITQKKDFVSSPVSIFFDGFSRIIIAYLIYQFIQAFRKHGKKPTS